MNIFNHKSQRKLSALLCNIIITITTQHKIRQGSHFLASNHQRKHLHFVFTLQPFPCFFFFLVHPIRAYISAAHGPFAWRDRTEIKPSNTVGESSECSFHLWTALLNVPINESYITQSKLSLPLLPPLPIALSPSIRQTWRSLWSMCSRGSLKRSQGSLKKAWTPTSMIQTQEVSKSVLINIPSLRFSSELIVFFQPWFAFSPVLSLCVPSSKWPSMIYFVK